MKPKTIVNTEQLFLEYIGDNKEPGKDKIIAFAKEYSRQQQSIKRDELLIKLYRLINAGIEHHQLEIQRTRSVMKDIMITLNKII